MIWWIQGDKNWKCVLKRLSVVRMFYYVNSQSVAGCQIMAGQTKGRALQQGFKDTQTQRQNVLLWIATSIPHLKQASTSCYGLKMLLLKHYCKRLTIFIDILMDDLKSIIIIKDLVYSSSHQCIGTRMMSKSDSLTCSTVCLCLSLFLLEMYPLAHRGKY